MQSAPAETFVPEAVAVIAKRYPETGAELDRLAARAFRSGAVEHPGRSTPGDLLHVARRILPGLMRRRHYERLRLSAGGLPETSLTGTLWAELKGVFGQDLAELIAGAKDELRAALGRDLAAVEATISAWSGPAEPGSPEPSWSLPPTAYKRLGLSRLEGPGVSDPERRAWKLAGLLALREDLGRRVAGLAPGTGSTPTQEAAGHAAKVVQTAGGPGAVARRVAEGRKARGVFHSADADGPELARLEHQAAGLGDAVKALSAGGRKAEPGGHAAEAVAAHAEAVAAHAEVAGKAEALRAVVEARQGKAAAALVAATAAGDKLARERLVQEARAFPSAFPPGFALALLSHEPIGEPLDGVVAELARQIPEHSWRPTPTDPDD